jgi:hypothetical protein
MKIMHLSIKIICLEEKRKKMLKEKKTIKWLEKKTGKITVLGNSSAHFITDFIIAHDNNVSSLIRFVCETHT